MTSMGVAWEGKGGRERESDTNAREPTDRGHRSFFRPLGERIEGLKIGTKGLSLS